MKLFLFGRIFFQSLVFILLVFPSSGQNEVLTFKSFAGKEGIIDLSIRNIVRDDDGFIWLGTPKGLFRYDGHQALPYKKNNTLLSANITSLFKDRSGYIWAGTFSKGLFRIDTKFDTLNWYQNIPGDSGSLSANRIHTIIQDESDQIWIALEKEGIDLFEEGTNSFSNFKISDYTGQKNLNRINTVLSMQVDPYLDHVLWLGTLYGLIKLNTELEKMQNFRCEEGNTTNPADINNRENTIKAIFCDEKVLLLGTWGGGLCVFEKDKETWTSYKFESPFPASGMRNDVTAFLQKSKDEFWMLAYRQPLGIFNKKTRSFQFLRKEGIVSLYRDQEENIWFGTNKELLVLFPRMEQFMKSGLPFDPTKIIFHPKRNKLYAGINFRAEILEMDIGNGTVNRIGFSPFFDKGSNFIMDLQFSSEGILYLLGISGVYSYDEERKMIKKVFSPQDLPGNTDQIIGTTAFSIDDQNNCWLGTKFDGLYKYNLESKEILHFGPEEKRSYTAWISDFHQDSKGNIWYGSGRGFGYYDPKEDRFIEFPDSREHTFPDKLTFDAVTSVIEDQSGKIWIGSLEKGLGYFNVSNPEKIHTFTIESSGLWSDVIYELAEDHRGRIWMLTRSGMSLYDPEKDEFDNFGIDYGLKNLSQISTIGREEILLSASGGYYHFHPDSIQADLSLPEVQITQFRVFDQVYQTPKNINLVDTILLNYKQNFFSVDYTGIDYRMPEMIRYAYKLEGLHDNWIESANRRTAGFTGIGGGEYTLKLKASIGNGSFGKVKELKIIVKPPFWQTWWFWIIMTFFFLLALYAIIQNRVRTIRKTAKRKADFEKRLAEAKLVALQAQMNPHFLFNCLNSIKLLIMEEETEKASLYLTKFSKLIRLILNNSHTQFVILKDELESLGLYIEMESLRFDHEFSYDIDIEKSIDVEKYRVPPMIMQIFVENAIKHGLRPKDNDKKLSVLIQQSEKQVICLIRDNGIGRKAAKALKAGRFLKESLGIKITLERLMQLQHLHGFKSYVEIKDLYENDQASGTEVMICFPISQ